MLLGKSQFRVSEGIDLMSRIASSSISLAGSEEQMNFLPAISQNALNGFKKLYSCFVVAFRSFSQNFPLGAPDATMLMVIFRAWATCAVKRD